MPFEIVRNDITAMRVDAVVNTANPEPVVGSGVDAGIHRKAGPELLRARQKIGAIAVGQAALTPGFRLPAKFVIHTVGPVWRGGTQGEEELLRRCYEASLALAWKNGCESVAFPLIASGNYGFPRQRALQIALRAISAFLMEHEMLVYLVVFDREAFCLSEKLLRSVASFIDENYVQEKSLLQRGMPGLRRNAPLASRAETACLDDAPACALPPRPQRSRSAPSSARPSPVPRRYAPRWPHRNPYPEFPALPESPSARQTPPRRRPKEPTWNILLFKTVPPLSKAGGFRYFHYT